MSPPRAPRRRTAALIAVVAIGVMLVAALVAALVWLHGMSSLPPVTHP